MDKTVLYVVAVLGSLALTLTLSWSENNSASHRIHVPNIVQKVKCVDNVWQILVLDKDSASGWYATTKECKPES